MSDDRLDRIEGKVDKLADAIIQMARMEERLVSVFKRMDNTEATLKNWITDYTTSNNKQFQEVKRLLLLNASSG